jgi:hypothetical protein
MGANFYIANDYISQQIYETFCYLIIVEMEGVVSQQRVIAQRIVERVDG